MSEKPRLNVEENGSGIRYYRKWNKKRFRSPTYPKETRESERQAWSLFLQFKQDHPKQPKRKATVIDRLRQEISERDRQLDGATNPAFIEQTTGEIEELETEIKRRIVADQLGINFDRRNDDSRNLISSFFHDDDDVLGHLPIDAQHKLFNPELLIEPLPDNRIVEFWRDSYFANRRKLSHATNPASHDNRERNINHFIDFVGKKSSVDIITTQKWEKFTEHVIDQKFADSTQKLIISDCTTFVEYLVDHDVIDRPKRLREYKTIIETQSPKHYTIEELQYLLRNSTGFLNCVFLLMCNCGMTQKDIADIKISEYNDGCITRHRSKRKKGDRTPIVKWQLWAETIKAIEEHRCDKDGLLFKQDNGKKWVYVIPRQGKKASRYDAIRKIFDRWKKHHPQRLTLKNIRKSAATYLCENTNTQIKFLCEVPSGVAAKNYVDTEQHIFDGHVQNLRTRLIISKT